MIHPYEMWRNCTYCGRQFFSTDPYNTTILEDKMEGICRTCVTMARIEEQINDEHARQKESNDD